MKIRQLLTTILTASVLSGGVLFSNLSLAAEPAETITIRNDGDNTYYEFRINGEISEIKVVPKVGPAYYLVPANQEDGNFVRKDNPDMRVPKWVIFRW